jgi:hypothetical protein
MNEPEGCFAIANDTNACFDTTPLQFSGAGWVGANVAIRNLLRFINLQAATIHSIDRNALVTIGSWSEKSQTDQFGYRNYYTDQCLRQAGGRVEGVLDLNQMHTYAKPLYGATAPFSHNHTAADYNTPNPLILGEFSQDEGAGMSSAQQYTYALTHGYAGAWGWQANGSGQGADNMTTLISGMQSIGKAPPKYL